MVALIGQKLGEGDAGSVIDGDVEKLPSGAAGVIALAVASDAVADPLDAGELLDIEVDEFARVLTLVAAHRRGRLPRGEPGEAVAAQDARYGGLADGRFAGGLEGRETQPAQGGHARGGVFGGCFGGKFGGGTPVVWTGFALG